MCVLVAVNIVTYIYKRCSMFVIRLYVAIVSVASITTEDVLTLISHRLYPWLCHLMVYHGALLH
jgi:hypothetical protein